MFRDSGWQNNVTTFGPQRVSSSESRAEVRSFITTTVRDESQVTPQGFEPETNGFQF